MLTRRNLISGVAATTFAAKLSAPVMAQANRGGHLRLAVSDGATTDTLDPADASTRFTHSMCVGAVYECLTEFGSDNQLRGELAESWEVRDIASTWHFSLVQGVEFHDGKDLGPVDVVATFERLASRGNRAPRLLQNIDRIEVDGSYAVFRLKSPDLNFMIRLSQTAFAIVPDGFDPRDPVGTGPYKTEAFEPGVRFLGYRNPRYWFDDEGYFDSIELISVPDQNALLSGIISGDFHVADPLGGRVENVARYGAQVDMVQQDSSRYIEFAMDVTAAPFDNPNVRRAMKLAIDRNRIATRAYDGHARVANDTPIDGLYPHGAKLTDAVFNPSEAKLLLKDAGFDNLSVDLHVGDVEPGLIDAAHIFADSAAQANIKINVVVEPAHSYWSNVWRARPFYATVWNGRQIAEEALVKYDSSHSFFEKTLPAGTTDGLSVDQIIELAQKDSGSIIPVFLMGAMVRNKNVGAATGRVGRHFPLDNFRVPRRWSFDVGGTVLSYIPSLQCVEGECSCGGTNTCDSSCCSKRV